ncbi:chemotaxis-specific protein-glutamate methyltransferase CheB [Kallotenue papyrolyticum]|uniref:chemotaxis-specific protein-glutamate methyltransferase CheB n=1 Tax=Kallotenue papyrolyticum TaxID=1325125 RepID=UPI0004785936|nr:chemotaxis-specific protein-glutamate methyltransferase CheB [Kallotenue papyrolyticum]
MTIRVLVVDDSALMRRALTALLASDPEIEVVGTASDGRAAIEQVAALRPDVITMDVRMPIMDGAQTTEHIMAYYPTPILVLTASLSRFDVDITFKMLGLGALDVMEKPPGGDPAGLERARLDLIRRVKMLSRVRVVTHLRGRRRSVADLNTAAGQRNAPVGGPRHRRGSRPLGTGSLRRGHGSAPLRPPEPLRRSHGARLLTPAAPPAPRTALGGARHVVVIGASTGGPRVVQQILRELPPSFPAAVLVVQHIADGFTAGMVDWLDACCALPVALASAGDLALPGHVYVAPDNLHLLIDREGVLGLSPHPALLQRPSVDVTMERAAEAYGARVIGVLLTGMGRDGAIGLGAIRRAGGYTIAQDGDSCVVFGMPRAAIEVGAACEVLRPEAIAGRLQMLLRDAIARERP